MCMRILLLLFVSFSVFAEDLQPWKERFASHPLRHGRSLNEPLAIYFQDPKGNIISAPFFDQHQRVFDRGGAFKKFLEGKSGRAAVSTFDFGGVWLEVPEIWGGMVLYYQANDSLPDLSGYEEVNAYQILEQYSTILFRRVARVNLKGTGPVQKNFKTLKDWMEHLRNLSILSHAEFLKISPEPPREIWRNKNLMTRIHLRDAPSSQWINELSVSRLGKDAPASGQGYWIEASGLKEGVQVFYPYTEPLPRPHRPITLSFFTVDGKPAGQINSAHLPEGATMDDALKVFSHYGIKALDLKSKPIDAVSEEARKDSAAWSFYSKYIKLVQTKGRTLIKEELSPKLFRVHLPESVMQRGERAVAEVVKDPLWEGQLLGKGVWLKLPELSGDYLWSDLSASLEKLRPEEKVEIYESIVPQKEILVKGTASAIRQLLKGRPMTIEGIMNSHPTCAGVMARFNSVALKP